MVAMCASPAAANEAPLVEGQHAVLSAAMTNARRARMCAEADAMLLANRLARLEAEELRAIKRIEETHRRTQEILAIKARHQQSDYEKQLSRLGQDEAVERHKHALLEAKEQQRAAVVAAREAQTAARSISASEAKRANEANAVAIARARTAERAAAAARRNSVKEEKEAARRRREQEKRLLIAAARQRASERTEQNERAAARYELEVMRLRKEEAELIEALGASSAKREGCGAQERRENMHPPSGPESLSANE